MVAKVLPDQLPSGWTVQFRVLKTGRKVGIYTNTETGKKFFSKDEIFQFINAGSGSSEPQTSNTHARRQAERAPSLTVNEKDQLPEWLPKGWKVEVRTRKSGTLIGKEYKSYIDPLSGSKFYSKLEVLRYLKTVRHKSRMARDVKPVKGDLKKKNLAIKPIKGDLKKKNLRIKQAKGDLQKKTAISMRSEDKVVVQKSEAEGLPSGWIKEIKIRKSSKGLRKDPFYKDPVSGYVFRSKKDALRYIETGEISTSAIRPKESCSNAPELVKDKTAPSWAAKRQKLKHPESTRQLIAGKTESQMSDSEPSKIEVSNVLSAKRVSPEARVTSASRDETVQEKHPLNNLIPECVETKEKCSPNKSSPQKDGDSKRHGNKSLPDADPGLDSRSRGNKHLAKNSPVSTPISDTLQDRNFFETAMEKSSAGEIWVNSRTSKDSKVHDAPETSRSKKDLAKSDPVLTATPNNLHGKNFLETTMEKRSIGDTRVNSRKSKDKKVHNLPPRSSKRLAGNEPDLAVNLELGERALITAIRKSKKTEAIQDSVSTSDGLVGSSLTQLEIRSETEIVDNASTNSNNPLEENPSNNSTVPVEDQVARQELHQKVETEKVYDDPEPQLSFLFGSDPCLEFAFKTLIGELPLDDSSVNEPISSHADGTLQHENLLESGMNNSSTGKGHGSKTKSKNKKELSLPRRSSKRLAGVEPELVANSVTSERTFQDASINPYDEGTVSRTDLLDIAKQPLQAGAVTNRLSSNTDASIPEPSDKRKKSLEDLAAAPQEQPQICETERVELEKPDLIARMYETETTSLKNPEPAPQMHESGKGQFGSPEPDVPFSIADYWSDPCLDFAFKTLTGIIPIEDTLAQGCFQEQFDAPDSYKNGNGALPDFGSCSLFQTDISSQFDTLEKPASSQQFAGASSSLPPPNVSFSSCNGIHSQQPSLEANKDLHQKVKS